MLKTEWKEQGFIDEPVAEGTDLKAEIRRMCKEKDAIILAHYYTVGDIQDVADFVGDSLALARKAAETDAKMMVMCGVHFMAETCKLLSPDKVVLCPDLNAGCSLADSCKAEDLKKYKDEHPGYQVVSYVNTTAAVKALTDVVVTSGNAKKVVDQLPKDAKLIFGPDYNLGNYINEVTGRQMLLWNGGCHVHERFSVAKILELLTWSVKVPFWRWQMSKEARLPCYSMLNRVTRSNLSSPQRPVFCTRCNEHALTSSLSPCLLKSARAAWNAVATSVST